MTNAQAIKKLKQVIEASGLSQAKWATDRAIREPRTIRRWLSGDSPIPQVVIDILLRD